MDTKNNKKSGRKFETTMSKFGYLVKKNRKHILAISTVLLVYAVVFVLILNKDILPQSTAQEIYFENGVGEIPVGEIVENTTVVQTFKGDSTIKGISLNLATYARTNTGILNVRVTNIDTGKEILNAQTDIRELIDNSFRTYYFNTEIKNDHTNIYNIIVTTEETYKGNAPTIWSSKEDSYPEGTLTVNGVQKAGDLAFKLIGNGNGFVLTIYTLAALVIFVFLLFIYYLVYIKRSRVEKVFLPAAIFIGIVYMLLLQPGVVPDEPAHIDTGYRYSNAILLKGIQTESGGMLKRQTDINSWNQIMIPTKETYKDYMIQVTEPCGETKLVETVGGYVKTSPLLYLFSSIGVTLARLLNFNSFFLLCLGRLFNLLFFVIMTYIGIKKMPFGKLVLFVVALFPMTMQQAASFSYDAVINGLAFCFIGYCLNIAYSSSKPTKKDFVILCVLGVFLAPAKYIYVGICLLMLLIPKSKFSSSRKKTVYLVTFAICAMILFLATNLFNIVNRLSIHVSGAPDIPPYTLDYIFTNPLDTLKLFLNTFAIKGDYYISTTIGRLGWLNIPLPWIIIFGFIILFIFSCWRRQDDSQYIDVRSKILVSLIVTSVFILAHLSMMLVWTPNTFSQIEGVQGRYFLPAVPLVGLLFRNSSIVLNKNIDKTIMFSCVILSILSILNIFTFIISG